MKRSFFFRTYGGSPAPQASPAPSEPATGGSPAPQPPPSQSGAARSPVRWYPSSRSRNLATAALLALIAVLLTGRAALIPLAAPALGALALSAARRPAGDLTVEVTRSGSRCFEHEDVTITVAVRGGELDEIVITLDPAPQVTVADMSRTRTFLRSEAPSARWVLQATRWGRYSPGVIRVRATAGGWATRLRVPLEPLQVFPRPSRLRPRLVPAELLRRIGEHTGRAVGDGVEFAGIRPYVPGDPLRDVNRPVSIRRGQLHVNQRSAARAADLVVMIDAQGRGPVADRTMDLAVHGAAALVAAYLRVSDRVGLVVLGGMLRWLGPAAGDRQFFRIAEMMLQARYDSFVAPDLTRVPRTALPPGTLVVAFTPLLDPAALTALTDLRRRGFPLIVVDTLRDEPPASARDRQAALALRLWRLTRAATRAALTALAVPVLTWPEAAELDEVLAPLRHPPPAVRR
jgi:uncharacterized protein (DUF58 family)